MNLVPLFEEALEFQDYNGTVLSDGKIAVYYIGRTRLADIYEDVEGSVPAENPRILNNLGMGPVYVNPAFDYEMVVFDAYDSELFSVKKYLASKGEHSTANVVVTPSESIAVSAWTVGDVQVYMPYLTGQLGKVYTGIDPIVVNNVEDKISANHVPLGVQDPLYFVQDDEEGCIIGCSAQTEIPSALSGKWDEASDAVIANSAQWAEGTEYEAGSYVDIDGHTISVTGLQPAGNYQSAGDYVVHDELSSYATQDWVENQSYMKEYMESAFYPSTSNPSGYLTAHQDISNKLDTTAFSTVSGDFLTAVPSEYVTENTLQSGLSSKLDSTAFSTVSGDFLTAHQSLDGLMSADLLEISDNKITGYNGTAFAGQGGGVSGDFELSAGSGISIVDYPLEQKTVISVTAQGGNPEVEQAVIDNSATWNNVSAKLDTTAFSDVSGTFLTAHQDLSDYQTIAGMTAYQPAGDYLTTADSGTFLTALPQDLVYTADIADMATTGDLTGKQDITGMTAYATVESLTAKQDAGDYLSASDSANFLLTSDSGNFYPMNENPAGYLTAHQSLADYQLTADMTAYANSASVTGTAQYGLTTAGWTEITAGSDVPEGVMVESGLEYDGSGNISAYSGSAFATQLPEEEEVEFEEINISGISAATDYVTATSGDINATIDNVSANSGAWGGSALPISAGPGVKVNLVDNTLVFSNDETVLWAGNHYVSATSSFALSESPANFEYVEIYGQGYPGHQTQLIAKWYTKEMTNDNLNCVAWGAGANAAALRFNQFLISGNNTNTINVFSARQFSLQGTAASTAASPSKLIKIVGINHL